MVVLVRGVGKLLKWRKQKRGKAVFFWREKKRDRSQGQRRDRGEATKRGIQLSGIHPSGLQRQADLTALPSKRPCKERSYRARKNVDIG